MKKTIFNGLLLILASISLVGCGGGGGSGGSGTSTTSSTINAAISGTAATGAAIAGGTVDFVCANGATGTTTTADDGTYTMNLTGVTLPCAVKVTVPSTQQKSIQSSRTARPQQT